jgi:hypothetical protein
MEAGVVIGANGEPLFWHVPEDRTSGSLPDSRQLWDVLWDNRTTIQGFAHSHPGSGIPGPSYTDVTTFAAIESALGHRLAWWIASDTHVVIAGWHGPDKLTYGIVRLDHEPSWVAELRRRSHPDANQKGGSDGSGHSSR